MKKALTLFALFCALTIVAAFMKIMHLPFANEALSLMMIAQAAAIIFVIITASRKTRVTTL